jgi:hypothetical protein
MPTQALCSQICAASKYHSSSHHVSVNWGIFNGSSNAVHSQALKRSQSHRTAHVVIFHTPSSPVAAAVQFPQRRASLYRSIRNVKVRLELRARRVDVPPVPRSRQLAQSIHPPDQCARPRSAAGTALFPDQPEERHLVSEVVWGLQLPRARSLPQVPWIRTCLVEAP